MAALIIWKNQEIDRLKKDMDRLLARFRDDFCSPLLLRGFREEPYLELSETQDDLLLKAEIPDVRPKDLDITISDDLLTIRADVKQEAFTEGGFLRERNPAVSFSHHPAPLQGPRGRGSSHLPGRHSEHCHAQVQT
jgi:HSP20 family protein